MEIRYAEPLRSAWTRARGMLFPFRVETWLVLGFAAFLSEWVGGGMYPLKGGGGGGSRVGMGGWHWPVHDLLPYLVWGPVLAGILAVGIVVGILFLWIGSRGKFVFLDDVVQRRASVVEPWGRLGRLGDSLFLWKLVFGVLVGFAVLSLIGVTMGSALLAWLKFREPIVFAPPIALGAATLFILTLAAAFVMLMLDSFVVPIMYRHGISTNAAWARFAPLLREHTGSCIFYALVVLVLYVALGAVIAAVGLATCCVGFFFLLVPYVGQVVLLPLYVTYRGFSLAFLAQFGPEYDVFAPGAANVPGTPPQA